MRAWRKALHRAEWQPWFAWHPVKAKDSLVWLQWIERRRCYAIIDEWWEWRLPLSEEAGGEIMVPGRDRKGGQPWPFLLRTAMQQEGGMGLTGKFKFRKKLWGKIVLQVEKR